jgi:hypothetical protein
MGQKINPIGLRLGINKTWDSRWFAGDDYAAKLHEDIKIRRHVKKALKVTTPSPAAMIGVPLVAPKSTPRCILV